MPSLIYARADEPAPATEPTDAPIMSLREALKKAQPGTLVQLLPGRLTTKIKVRDLHGREAAPIVIKGSLRETVIDGLADPLNVVEERAETWAWNSRVIPAHRLKPFHGSAGETSHYPAGDDGSFKSLGARCISGTWDNSMK